MHSRVKQEHGSNSHPVYNSFGQSNGVKAERSPSRTMPGAFQEDSDSDIEIIPASTFYHDRPVPKTEPKTEPSWFSSSPVRNVEDETKDALRLAMYGNNPVPDWMNTPGSFPQAGMSDLNPLGHPNGTSLGNFFLPNNFVTFLPTLGQGFFPDDFEMLPDYSSANLHVSQPGIGGPSDYGMNQPAASHSLNQRNPLADILAQSPDINYLDFPNYLDNDVMPNYLDYTMNDPRKTNDDIKALLDNIKPDLDVAPEAREETPEGMRYPLVSVYTG